MENTVSMDTGRKEFIITWFIENYSYCWHNNGAKLPSQEFTTDCLENTKWTLQLYPRGYEEKHRGYVSLFLERSLRDEGPECLPLEYELAVLAPDESYLVLHELEYKFKKGSRYGKSRAVDINVLLRRKEFLPKDILSIRCKMWGGEGNIQSVTHISAVTCINIEHVSYLQVVEDFSALEPKEKNTFEIASPSNGVSLTSNLFFSNDSCCKGKITMEIIPDSEDDTLLKCKLFLLSTSGKLIECGIMAGNPLEGPREDIENLYLSLSNMDILKRKNELLPDDKLSLLCDCTFCTGCEDKILKTHYQLPVGTSQKISNNYKKDMFNGGEKLGACSNALNDLKAVYDNPFLTDVKLETETKSFPAHKILLSARSPVFKSMLTSDMKEKNTDCIKVNDLENNTLQQLLLFLYSDNLENLEWESALKLYYAGDKYAIERLKILCSSFLVNNLNASNASELLLLADTHNDLDLRELVENFILQHEEDVYSSDKWEWLMETNPQLVLKTMHLKYKRKEVIKTVVEKDGYDVI